MTIQFKAVRSIAAILIFMTALSVPEISSAQSRLPDPGPSRYGMAGVWGKTFDPVTDIHFFKVAGVAFWDYDPIWRDLTPESMKFKIEGAAGAAYAPKTRFMASLSMLAHYRLDFLAGRRLTPFLEGGIGLAYTDFQVTDPEPPGKTQGSRFNFNPVIGIGMEFNRNAGDSYFAAVRLNHLSNGDLNSENRGVNAVVFLVGRFFDKRR
ncbi:MAG: acyloxyacyl hydrolase [Desulfobacterales bacterium]|nr:acyloxyacyl hydrolase [Desulfobacterales bacterium]